METETDWVEVRFRIPRVWRDELVEACGNVGLAHLADLLRMIVRAWLRNRYTVEQREVLR